MLWKSTFTIPVLNPVPTTVTAILSIAEGWNGALEARAIFFSELVCKLPDNFPYCLRLAIEKC